MNVSKSLHVSFRQFNQRYSQKCLKSYQTILDQNLELSSAVREAEKVIGYSTSFLNLRWLLTDELANVALNFRKLAATNHPLLQTARKLFIGNNSPGWGLITLLISKTAGLNSDFTKNEKDVTTGVLHSQRVLAEVTEMIRTSNLIHKSLINIDEDLKKDLLELNFGNKVALLSGDYLLSKSSYELACLKNQNLIELMSSAVRDLAEAEFIRPRDKQDRPLPCKPSNAQTVTIFDQFGTEPYDVKEVLGNPRAEWTLRNILGGASLLGKSCQGALKLAKHSEEIQELGYLFGKNTALAWQAQVEQEEFLPNSSGIFSLVSAPVMLHLEHDPSLYEKIEQGLQNVLEVDYEDMRQTIQAGPGVENTRNLQKELSNNALNVLNKFPYSDARSALENIINIML